MSKDIKTLVPDIYRVLDEGRPNLDDEHPDDIISYALNVANAMRRGLTPRTRSRVVGKYWATDLGRKCLRQLWYDFNAKEDEAEQLEPYVKFKFMYGDTIEEKALFLATIAGHDVSMQQHRIEHEFYKDVFVSGKIDAAIDGRIIDVKSASSFAYSKYTREGITPANDTFGYLWQLSFYFLCYDNGGTGPELNDEPGFFFVDKSLGHMDLQIVPADTIINGSQMAQKVKDIHTAVQLPSPPGRPAPVAMPVADGKSGNMKLCTMCSYCKHKQTCYPKLRTFLYSTGPKFLTDVARLPKVPEVT